jgi:hypothetical protein
MSVTNAFQTYGNVARREDVVENAIEILTATEDNIQKIVGKTTAKDEVHSFLTDTLATAASLAVQQGANLSAAALSQPARLTNIVQEVARPILVTQKAADVEYYNGVNQLAYQETKALKDFSNGVEFDVVRSTLVSGVSGTVAKMNGIIAAISKSTNTTLQTSGTVFSATILDGLMAKNWENSNGDVATDIYVGSGLRQVTDTFVQKTNVVVNTPNSVMDIVRTVSTFETSFGTVRIHTHRFVQQTADANGRVLAIRPEKIKLAYLRRPMVMELAKDGPYDKRAVYGSLTVEVRNQDSNWFADGYLKTL